MSARLKRSTASSCGTPWTTSRSTGSCSHASTTKRVPFFSKSEGACTTSGRSRSTAGTASDRAPCEAARHDGGRIRHPTRRRVRADDRGVELLPVLELVERLPANVVAEEMHDGPLPRRLEDRHVQRLGDECLAEVEVEEIRLREVLRKRAPLHQLLTQESLPGQVEVDVVLVGTPLLRPEDQQPCVDVLAPQGVHVRPAGAGEIHW